MKSKESKESSKPRNTTKHQEPANPAGPTKSRGRRNNTFVNRESSPSPVKTEERIDPQLAFDGLPLRSHHDFQESPSQEAALRHRTHIPRMIDWQKDSPSNRMRSSSLPPYQKSPLRASRGYDCPVDETESEYFRMFIRSPVTAVYPEPPNLLVLRSESARPQAESEDLKDTRSVSPVLKGVKYPGMSLFDSASEQAQRLRNQKKASSVLDQMVLDSAAIEPVEHIYWPEGGLKKSRVITGNVESSPIKEPTPPLKRRRTRASRYLADLNTNAPRLGQKRGRKPRSSVETETTGLRNVAHTALDTLRTVYPRNAHMGYDLTADRNYEAPAAEANKNSRNKATFPVFRDTHEPGTQTHTKARAKKPLNSENVLLPRDPNSRGVLPPSYSYPTKSTVSHASSNTALTQSRFARSSLRLSPDSPIHGAVTQEERENEVAFLSSMGSANNDTDNDEPERVIQRYFSVIGNQPPQFFSSMPPQMDFGGVGGPEILGTTLNPLNPFLNRHYQQPHFAPAMFARQDATMPSALHQVHSTSDGDC